MSRRRAVQHATDIARGYAAAPTGVVPTGVVPTWLFECACGVQGGVRVRRADAEADRKHHLEAVAPEPGRRCRSLAEHGNRWWEPCPLCDAQDPIPGMEHLDTKETP